MWKDLSKFVCVIAVCIVSMMNASHPAVVTTTTDTTTLSSTEATQTGTTEVSEKIDPDDGAAGKLILVQTRKFKDYLENFMQRTRARVFMNYSTMMDQTLTGIVDEEIDRIKCLVKLTSHGAVAENACYLAANESITDLVVTVYNNLRPCLQAAGNSHQEARRELEGMLTSIKTKYDRMMSHTNDCENKPGPDVNRCHSGVLPHIESNFCETVTISSKAQATLKRKVQQLKETCRVCLDRVNATTRVSVEPIRTSAYRCICNNGVTRVTDITSCMIPAVPIAC